MCDYVACILPAYYDDFVDDECKDNGAFCGVQKNGMSYYDNNLPSFVICV